MDGEAKIRISQTRKDKTSVKPARKSWFNHQNRIFVTVINQEIVSTEGKSNRKSWANKHLDETIAEVLKNIACYPLVTPPQISSSQRNSRCNTWKISGYGLYPNKNKPENRYLIWCCWSRNSLWACESFLSDRSSSSTYCEQMTEQSPEEKAFRTADSKAQYPPLWLHPELWKCGKSQQ